MAATRRALGADDLLGKEWHLNIVCIFRNVE
jgi:hypothetical protein